LLTLRDPIHGFIRADPLEAALIDTAPLQRLRFVRQLGLTFLVYPGAEHSRFSHALGAMALAGRVYDALAAKSGGSLPVGPRVVERRLVRAAALLHDLGHAPFSHSAEELFEDGIDHEEMTRRLLGDEAIESAFARLGDGISPADVARVLAGAGGRRERLLTQIVTGELDVDKMDYLLRDSLYCGVRYGSFDLDRLLETIVPLMDPERDEWGIGVEEGGVHALEALVMARYYMFTQVYFNVVGKALELHLAAWMADRGGRWPADPRAFQAETDLTVLARLREATDPHARAIVRRAHYPLAFETREHLTREDHERFEALLPGLEGRFGRRCLLVSNSTKDPHRMAASRVLVLRADGRLEPMDQFSHFIRHLGRIDRFRVYAQPEIAPVVGAALREQWGEVA
jgi:HD superfamily phosphohydrolase